MQNYSDTVDDLRNIISKYNLGLDKVLPMLEDLRREALLDKKMYQNEVHAFNYDMKQR